MPRMRVCGRKVDLATDDVACPAATSAAWRALWVLSLVGVVASAHSVGVRCDSVAATAAHYSFLYAALVLSAVGLALDVTMCCRGMQGTIVDDAPRRSVPALLQARMWIGVLDLAPYIAGLAITLSLVESCMEVTPGVSRTLRAGAIAGLAITIVFGGAVLALWLRGTPAGGSRQADDAAGTEDWEAVDAALRAGTARWARRCRGCSCLCRSAGFGAMGSLEDTFESVGAILASVFAAVDSLDLATSDLLAGLALVRLVQKEEEDRGRAATPAAAHVAPASSAARNPPRAPAGGAGAAGGSSATGAGKDSSPVRDLEMGLLADRDGTVSSPPPPPITSSTAPAAPTGPVSGVRDLDPVSNASDRVVLDEAAHYASYALAAYGWMIYAWSHCLTWPCRLPGWGCWYCVTDASEACCKCGPLEWHNACQSSSTGQCCAASGATTRMRPPHTIMTTREARDASNPLIRAHYSSTGSAAGCRVCCWGVGTGGLVRADVCGCNEIALRRMMRTALAAEALNRMGANVGPASLESKVVAAGAPPAAVATAVGTEASTAASTGADKVGGPTPGATAVPRSPPSSPPATALPAHPPFHHTDVLVTSHTNRFRTVPWFAAVDRQRHTLVITIRGTLSFDDCITDALARPVRIGADPDFEATGLRRAFPDFPWGSALVHSGMWDAAKGVAASLQELGLLRLATEPVTVPLRRDDGERVAVMHPPLSLVVCGHSLGSGVAALLGLLLQPHVPGARMYAFSPPGALVSAALADLMAGWTTSIVIGKDMIPRSSLPALQKLFRELVDSTVRCTVSKPVLMASATVAVCSGVGPAVLQACCTTANLVRCARACVPASQRDVVVAAGGGARGSLPASRVLLAPPDTTPDTPFVRAMQQLRRREAVFLERVREQHSAAGVPGDSGGGGGSTGAKAGSAAGGGGVGGGAHGPPRHGGASGKSSKALLWADLHAEMHVPGRVLHYDRVAVDQVVPGRRALQWLCCGRRWLGDALARVVCCCCRVNERRYVPRWVPRGSLNRILVSTDMLRDHMPDVVFQTVTTTRV